MLAQRLVRQLCPACKVPAPDGQGFAPVGCPACNHTGYTGRTGVFELFEVDDDLRAAIHARASEAKLRGLAQAAGMRNMRQDGQRYIDSGITSLTELLRVTRD